MENEQAYDFSAMWSEVVKNLPDRSINILEHFIQFFKIPNLSEENMNQWIKAGVLSFSGINDEVSLRRFFLNLINYYSAFISENLSRIDSFLFAINECMQSPYRFFFLGEFMSFFPSYFPDPNSIDLNLLLALQSPIFSYATTRHPDSDAVCKLWFHKLAESKGVEIFKDNSKLAISYFKIMNHAFFQVSVTTTQGAQQESLFVEAQKAMKSAIVAITKSLYSE